MNASHCISTLLLAISLVVCFETSLQGSSPQLNVILPRGVQRGQQHVLTFYGARLEGAEEVFLYSSGVTVDSLEQLDANKVQVSITVDEHCRLGEHVAQLRTGSGITEYRSFFVGALPQVDEAESNNSFSEPQIIEKNVTVAGVLQNEDVDFYQITASKGERISVEIEGIRLGSAMIDPFIAILDSSRFELAAEDDTPLLKQDCFVSIVAPTDGQYTILVRDAAYGGNQKCRYRLHVGNFPRPTVVYPAGGPTGQETDLSFIGDSLGVINQTVTISDPGFRPGLFVTDEGGISPSPVAFRNVEFGNVFEVEPNANFDQATAIELPNAINGIIEQPRDQDWYKINGKAGQVFDIEVFARRVNSALDPVLNVWGPDKKRLIGNDDSRGPDCYLRLEMKADGDYWLRIRDHLNRGQNDFVYRVEIRPVKPYLSLNIPRVDRYSQKRQTIVVPKGNRFATRFVASRGNFGGELKLLEDQLPPGIKMHYRPMAANLNQMPVVFEATEDAQVNGKLIDLVASHVDDDKAITGRFNNLANFVRGQPNNARYVGCTVDRLATAVVNEVPFKIEIVQPKAPLVRDGSINIKVIAHRKEGFTKPIRLEFPFRPPGIGTKGSVMIPEGKNEALYPLNANGNAQIRDWPVYILASADVAGSAFVSSQLATLTVAERFVSFDMKRAGCEQGKETQVICSLSHLTPFDGQATAQLLGVPPHTDVSALEFNRDTKELVFTVKTKPETPPGKHKGLFCRVRLQVDGEDVIATVGRTELQVDKPIVQTTPKPTTQPAEVAQTTPTKPLSRLEKLRKQASELKQGGK